MTTETRAEPTGTGVVRYRLTARQFIKMLRAGVIPEGDHVELLGGVIVAMTKYPEHNVIVAVLADRLRSLALTGWSIREEKSSGLGKFWRPEPDICVIRGTHTDYWKRDPRGADIGLMIEVAVSSYAKDAGVKRHAYAAARVPTYWIVNVAKRQVEVYTVPQGRGLTARYQNCLIHSETEQVATVIDGVERGRISVADLLP